MGRAQRNRDLGKNKNKGRINHELPYRVPTAIESWRGVRICGGDIWNVEWVETHNYRMPRQYAVMVTSRTGTYRLCVMKKHGALVDDMQHWNVPVLQYC